MAWEKNKSDIKDWKRISEKTAGLLIEQAQTLLKETVETAKLIAGRADKLITIQITFITTIIVFLFQSIPKEHIGFLQLTGINCLIVLLISSYYSYKSYRKYIVALPGEYPKTFTTSQFIDNDLDEKQQYIQIALSTLENLQIKIDLNIEGNKKRMRYNTFSLNTLIFTPAAPIVAYLFLHLFHV